MRVRAMVFSIVGAVSVAGYAVVATASPKEPIGNFQVVIERSSKGWNMHCDTGCAWKDLTVACVNACSLFVDADGATQNVADPKTKSAFGFVLNRSYRDQFGRTVDMPEADGVAGTVWNKLSWGCSIATCKAKVTERGVTPVLPGGF